MKKILIYLLTFVFLFTIFSAAIPQPVSANVTINNITITPLTEGVNAEYKIEMRVGVVINTNTAEAHNIYLQFPSEYNLPASINLSNVTISDGVSISSSPSAISIDANNVVALTLVQSILVGQPVFIIFSSSAGIVNPAYGVYSIKIWTSAELNPVTSESFLIAVSGGSGNPVLGLTVSVAPLDAGEAADYLVQFSTTGGGDLLYMQNDYVDVYFPTGTVFPVNPDASKVFLENYDCEVVEINGLRVRIYIPSRLGHTSTGPCSIRFAQDFGVKNPEAPGDYFLQVLTSKDTGIAISNTYQITGTPISSLSVTVLPPSQSTIAEYKVAFNTSLAGSMTVNSGKINIIFPDEVTLPASVIPGAITVNGIACVSATISDNKLIVTTPVNISASSRITVIIAPGFGIKNPDTSGTYNISVYTSADTVRVSDTFTVTSSQIIQPTVQLSTTSAGQVSAYTVSFTTGESGALVSGVDKISIIFPIGTTVPTSILTSAVTVNNISATYITVSVRTVTITVPTSTPANSAITVVISENANIVNPTAAASYVLNVSTTKETYSVASTPYTIYVTPATQLTAIPVSPNGLNGYYITQPTATLTASSIIDPNPFIYYYFDNNSPVAYTGQTIVVPEGFHTLFYYAVDHQGRQGGIKSKQFMVDIVPPQIVIASPADNATLNSKDVVVSGSVEVGANVKIDGQSVSVDAAGHFNEIITISGNSAVMTVTATDFAGNSVQEVIHVSLDTTPPALTVTSPIPFQEVHKLPVLVQGTTEPGATVTVNDKTATVDASGGFLYGLYEISEGEASIIQVVAKDVAGNATTETINIKYIKTTIIKLQVKNTVAMINATTISLDAPPIIKNGRTMVPVRFISEALGAEVSWDPVFQIIDIMLGSDTIRLQIGKNFASVNNKKIEMDTAPIIDRGRTMVPVRFISEALGAEVVWDDATKTVTIIYPKP